MFADLPAKKGISGKFGIFDGTQFLYKQGDWSAINLISLLWRYRMSIIKINSVVDTMLGKFER